MLTTLNLAALAPQRRRDSLPQFKQPKFTALHPKTKTLRSNLIFIRRWIIHDEDDPRSRKVVRMAVQQYLEKYGPKSADYKTYSFDHACGELQNY
jgi:hypothetical protein